MFMAPFNTHFLIAEKIWPTIRAMVIWPAMCNQTYYGQFCFGCVAPDVDKLSTTLTQKDTHFFDRTGDYELMATHRSAYFLGHQAEFLSQPFAHLSPLAQAFGLGYLCHLCVDEVSKQRWRHQTWLPFKHIGPGAAFAALDEAARLRIQNYPAIARAIGQLEPVEVIPSIPGADLIKYWQGVCRFVQANTLEEEFLALVDMFDRLSPAARYQKQQAFRRDIDQARRQVHLFEIDTVVMAGLAHSRRRLADLLAGRVPEPGYPEIG
jgi:hypothetical protein